MPPETGNGRRDPAGTDCREGQDQTSSVTSPDASAPSDLLRWGIIGPGDIAHRFAGGLAASRSGSLIAVASRSTDRAAAFIDTHAGAVRTGPAVTYGSYEALLADDDVDAVYVATTHPQHLRWAIATATAGKHLLVEKPASLNAAMASRIFDAARAADVFAMEAYVYRSHPYTRRIVDLIADGAIGRVLSVEVSFTFAAPFDAASRLFDPALAGGAILDVGGYPVSFAGMVAGAARAADDGAVAFAEPTSIRAVGTLGETGVDEWAIANVVYANGMSAHLTTGIGVAGANTARIAGTAGYLDVPTPWLPPEGEDAILHLHRVRRDVEEIRIARGNLYAIEADEIADHLVDRESPTMSWADTLANLRVMDAWRDQLGLRYDQETSAAQEADETAG
jgi:predicted dehydrogenase